MNTLSECVNSYLFLVNFQDYQQHIYELCLEKVKDGCLIALITSEVYDFSKILTELCLSKDQLKNFIIMYFNTIDDISRKLLLLHSWSLLPHMMVVDLSQLLHIEKETCATSAILMQKVALCAVSMMAYLESAASKAETNSSNNTLNGLLILRKVGDIFGETQIQIIKDLYFYKTEILRNFDGLRALICKPKGNF